MYVCVFVCEHVYGEDRKRWITDMETFRLNNTRQRQCPRSNSRTTTAAAPPAVTADAYGQTVTENRVFACVWECLCLCVCFACCENERIGLWARVNESRTDSKHKTMQSEIHVYTFVWKSERGRKWWNKSTVWNCEQSHQVSARPKMRAILPNIPLLLRWQPHTHAMHTCWRICVRCMRSLSYSLPPFFIYTQS